MTDRSAFDQYLERLVIELIKEAKARRRTSEEATP